ncbi:hypothetical protein KUTeg_014246 [Tegillarca granosa]|uniref:Sulfotransferase domain-containing protein n=1 Tax=Tegillarca granosa TaxID=220873 RepID=A0ABQ9F0G4_TEGGR|nr:hypothetical protein KUTeg_014246 [Tegillarca granosa]
MLLLGEAKRILLPHTPTIEFLTREEFDKMESPRVITTHLQLNQLPSGLVSQKCKIVMCHRNPKDVMVSFYHHHLALKQYEYNGKWENYFNRFMEGLIDFGSWFDYMKYWENVINDNSDLPIHVMYYEDLKQNGTEQIKKLADFLGVRYDDELIEAIHDMCSFNKMKPDKDQIANKDIKNDESSSFYRKGVIGDWKNWFTVAQNEYFNKVYEETMKNIKHKFTFE